MQVPRALHRANHVVTALHDHRWNFTNPADILNELIVAAEEGPVDEVMAFDSRESRRVVIFLESRNVVRIQAQKARGPFPDGPRSGGLAHDLRIFAGEPFVVCLDHLRTFGFRDGGNVLLPQIRKECAGAAGVLIEPVDLPLAQEEDAPQDQLGNAIRVCLRLGQRERGAP